MVTIIIPYDNQRFGLSTKHISNYLIFIPILWGLIAFLSYKYGLKYSAK